MFRRRIPVFALSLGCAGAAGWSMAKDGDAEAAAPEPAAAQIEEAAQPDDERAQRDDEQGDLLEQAQASIRDGEVDPELIAALGRSDDPRHKHAHRLLVAQTPTVAQKSEPKAKQDKPHKPAVEVTAPTPQPQPAAQPATQATTAEPADAPDDQTQATEPEAPISVLTSMKLERIGSVVALSLYGSETPDVGIVAQGDTDKKTKGPKTRRFVVEAAGAIPTFLQARPELEGVRVRDVRRGDKTIQLEVQLDPGWKVSVRSKLDNGFRITFRKG